MNSIDFRYKIEILVFIITVVVFQYYINLYATELKKFRKETIALRNLVSNNMDGIEEKRA
jgi:hypothetical protein